MESNSAFPIFDDADTLIIISASRRYKLHHNILAQASSTFAELFAEHVPPKLTRKGGGTKYHITLIDNENDDEPAHVLDRQEINAIGVVTSELRRPLGDSNENGKSVPGFLLAWDTVLGAFYSRPIDLGEHEADTGVDQILTFAMEVLKVAEYLCCVPLISPQIEATFLSLGQTLHRSISSVPAPWLYFAYRLRSRKLFKEALIHASGKFNTSDMKSAIDTGLFTPGTVELLTHKATAIRRLSQKLQKQLISWYPEQLQRTKTLGRADRDSIGRASYANDILFWMALTVFRHWVTQMVLSDKTHHAEDMGFEFFRLIARGGEAYLPKNVVATFHHLFPMSDKGEGAVENRLYEIKGYVATLVGEALGNTSLLDVERFPAGHMTVVPVMPDDFPWLREPKQIESDSMYVGGGDEMEEGDHD